MNSQQIFDKVCKHFAKQKQQSASGRHCKYRFETGNKKKVLKCGVGIFISKKEYKEDFEGLQVDLLNDNKIINDENMSLLSRIQRAHDVSDNINKIKSTMNHIADDFELNNKCVELITEWK